MQVFTDVDKVGSQFLRSYLSTSFSKSIIYLIVNCSDSYTAYVQLRLQMAHHPGTIFQFLEYILNFPKYPKFCILNGLEGSYGHF